MLRSPYLLRLAVFLMILYTITTTFVYFQQADITQITFTIVPAHSFLANIDIAVNMTHRTRSTFSDRSFAEMVWSWTHTSFLPLVSRVGFAAIGVSPVFTVLATFSSRASRWKFCLARPAREVLFTVLRREDKYKAKSLIDTFVYRVAIKSVRGPIHFAMVRSGSRRAFPGSQCHCGIWCILSLLLGRKQRRLRRKQSAIGPHLARYYWSPALAALKRREKLGTTKGGKTVATRTDCHDCPETGA